MEATDNQLILQAQKGDLDAFEELVHRYDRQVLSIALSFTRNSEDAKDIYQDVFMRVHKALPDFEFRSKFSTWLHRVATNVCLTHRSRSRDHLYDSLDGEDDRTDGAPFRQLASKHSSDEDVRRSEIAYRIVSAMRLLSPQQKLVFTMRHFKGYKLREIAEMMDCAEGTVKKYLFTATRRLREELSPDYGMAAHR